MTPTDRQCSLLHEHADVHICPEHISMINFVQVMLKLNPLASEPPGVYYK